MAPRDEPTTLAARVDRAARRKGARRVLLLDLDGTLAPIAATPEAARLPPGTLEALRDLLALGWTVAIVSGRPAKQVRGLVPLRGLRIFGSHGLEGSWREGRGIRLDLATRRRLAALARGGAKLASRTPGARLEHKPAGVAFHDRGVSASRLLRWRRHLRDWLLGQDLNGLETLRGRRVLELRPVGAHKGRVAEDLFVGAPTLDFSVVAMGDDRTDEDLFRALARRGLTIRVGRAGIRSAAKARLPSPASVRVFLATLAELSLRHRGARRRRPGLRPHVRRETDPEA